MTVHGFSHININCTDLDATVGFYAGLLGMPVAKRLPVRENTGALVGLAPPHTNRVAVLSPGSGEPGMELIEWHLPTPPPPVEAPAGGRLAGVAALRLTVADLEAVRGSLPEAEDRDGLVVTYAPEGERVELVQGDRTALQAVTVVVADLDAAARAYDAVLGIGPSPEGQRLGDDGTPFRELDLIVPAKPAPLTVTLREYRDGLTHVVPERRADTPGALRLAFFDKDIEGAHERALTAGGTSLSAPELFYFGSLTAHAALWFDRDGVLIEVLTFLRAESKETK
ncbi:VOC family protein [Actinocorallia sp. B10E7]|uniref:VOC family protein n=1 Tax=Actinocorallia sp. B10E7 TaxID=3153558 RepID=UPI00325D0257